METAASTTEGTAEITRRLAEFASSLSFEEIPTEAVTVAKHCLLDWFGVTLAGAEEPLTQKLFDFVRAEGCGDHATLVGLGARGSVSQAALINGSASHALDYDDVLRILGGHPTVPVAPPVLALAERDLKSGKDVITAFVAGVEAEARIGGLVGDCRKQGWHTTATVGTLGAAAGSARLLGLDAETTATAFGIAATQAAGLLAVFGTMCKPLHGGKAAANGYMAAELAARGFTSRTDIIECERGFAETTGDAFNADIALADLGTQYWTPNALFKYHAACFGTHAGLEGARAIRENPAFDVSKIERVDMDVPAHSLNVCNIQEPQTGLEIKFSHRFTTALALSGEETGALQVYSEEMAARPDLVALRDKVTVHGREDHGPVETAITVHQSDGTVIRERRDVSAPNADLDDQWAKLETKFRALAAPRIGEVNAERTIALVHALEDQEDVAALMTACSTIR